jgi:hypothetical protein
MHQPDWLLYLFSRAMMMCMLQPYLAWKNILIDLKENKLVCQQ